MSEFFTEPDFIEPEPNQFGQVTLPAGVPIPEQHHPEDSDSGEFATHHTLGPAEFQASPGNHVHLKGQTITGSRGGNAAVASIIAMLVQLGATDGTSA